MGKQDRSIRSSVRGLFEWMRQKIDWALNRGPIWIIGWLALAVFAVAFSSAVVVRLLHLTHDGSFGRVMWVTLIRTIDPGQIAEDKGGFAFLALGITLLGLLLFSSLISLTSGQFERRVEHVRRGRDEVRLKRQGKDEQPKQPYYVVLGWTDLTRKVVEELLFSGQASMRRRLWSCRTRPGQRWTQSCMSGGAGCAQATSLRMEEDLKLGEIDVKARCSFVGATRVTSVTLSRS